MKLIIDIDEDIYKMVCITGTFGRFRYNTAKAIKTGIPLDDFLKHRKEPIDKNVVDEYIDQLKKENV